MYDSRPRAVIITLGNNLYKIPEVVPPPVISLTTAKQRSKIVSQTKDIHFPYNSLTRKEKYCGHNPEIGLPYTAATDGKSHGGI